ncbi:MAG: YqgE/AlgH family protein, partial [Bacteroidales bacterium]|nr:YqgE/AlgH family protein [Bacteroidales bacterium]
KIDRLIQIKSNNLKPVKGQVLLSEPFMGDFYFGRSVVLLAEHNSEGSFGLILNKSIRTKLSDALKDFPELDIPMFLGGPVDANRLFFIHTLGERIESSIQLMDGLYWGGSMESVKEMASLNLLNEHNIRFFLGYSGWGTNQLEGELKRNSWAVTRITPGQIFHTKPRNLWNLLTKQLGVEYQLWHKFPSDPTMN